MFSNDLDKERHDFRHSTAIVCFCCFPKNVQKSHYCNIKKVLGSLRIFLVVPAVLNLPFTCTTPNFPCSLPKYLLVSAEQKSGSILFHP